MNSIKQVKIFLILLLTVSPVFARPDREPVQAIVSGDLPDTALIQLSSWIAGSNRQTLFLMDSAMTAEVNRDLLQRVKPAAIRGVVLPGKAKNELEKRLERKPDSILEWKYSLSSELFGQLFPKPTAVVVAPETPRSQLLQSAWLAGVLREPLVVLREKEKEEDLKELKRLINDKNIVEIVAVGSANRECKALELPDKLKKKDLPDEDAVAAYGRSLLIKTGFIRNLVITNPADVVGGMGKMSQLAPYMAAIRRASLLLTNSKGDNATKVISESLKIFENRQADTLVIVAGLKAIPTERRPNPVQGKDADIEMEPLTPTGSEPFTLSTGRLFHEFPGMVLVQIGRSTLLPSDGSTRHALVVSNPGGGLPLLETFSRHTSNELRNAGYKTTSMFGSDADSEKMRKLLPQQDIFLWEGHYRTLIDDFGFLKWTEPLPPALYFLQSCLALKEEEASPLFQRGAFAIVGTSTRTYSGTGGAFSVAFFDALAYENRSLGGALRQAKNFLVCYSLLKEKRLGDKAKLTGVNLRSAWAFTLWGDPTLQMPRPATDESARQPIRHEVKGNQILFHLPEQNYENVKVGNYNATMLPNARLAGLLTLDDEDDKHLVPFVFAEVELPDAPLGKKPKLSSRLNERSYVFNWDARRRVGYLLVTPRKPDLKELRFRVEWID